MPLSYVGVSVEEEEDNEQNNGDNENPKKKKKKEAKGNRFLIGSFKKAKKRIISKIKRKPLSPIMSSSSPPSVSASDSSCGFWKKVCLCGIEPLNTLDCSSSSTSDPKNETFTPEMLQTSDFFSRDCNPHI